MPVHSVQLNPGAAYGLQSSTTATATKPVSFGCGSGPEVQFGASKDTVHFSGQSEEKPTVGRKERFNYAGKHVFGLFKAAGIALVGSAVAYGSMAVKSKPLSSILSIGGLSAAVAGGLMLQYHKLMGLYQGARGLMANEA